MNDSVSVLKEILRNYPDIVNDSRRLRSILKDYFPEDRRIQNQLLMVVDEGILDDMQEQDMIKRFKMLGYIHGIADDYGIPETMAKEAVVSWCKALGVEYDDVQINESEIKHSNIMGNIVEVKESVITPSGDKKIYKFSGIGERVFTDFIVESPVYVAKIKSKRKYLNIKFLDGEGNEIWLANTSSAPCEVAFSFIEEDIQIGERGILKFDNCNEEWSVELIPM